MRYLLNSHFLRELHKLKQLLLSMGALVEDRLKLVLQALKTLNGDSAADIAQSDDYVDEMEVAVEEECLKILALYQPVAADLRFLVTATRINNDMERIGDEVSNIGHRIIHMATHERPSFNFDYGEMGAKTLKMLNFAMEALINMDVKLASKVLKLDDEVDALQKQAYDAIKMGLAQNPQHTGYLLNMFLVSRHLERIGDLATNICEDVIYMGRGEIVRHKKDFELEV